MSGEKFLLLFQSHFPWLVSFCHFLWIFLRFHPRMKGFRNHRSSIRENIFEKCLNLIYFVNFWCLSQEILSRKRRWIWLSFHVLFLVILYAYNITEYLLACWSLFSWHWKFYSKHSEGILSCLISWSRNILNFSFIIHFHIFIFLSINLNISKNLMLRKYWT